MGHSDDQKNLCSRKFTVPLGALWRAGRLWKGLGDAAAVRLRFLLLIMLYTEKKLLSHCRSSHPTASLGLPQFGMQTPSSLLPSRQSLMKV